MKRHGDQSTDASTSKNKRTFFRLFNQRVLFWSSICDVSEAVSYHLSFELLVVVNCYKAIRLDIV